MRELIEELSIDINLIKSIISATELNQTLLFDIETTGFSAKTQSIYMIGCIYFKNEKPYFLQWLCEKEEDEYELLFKFSKFIKDYTCIIHYNGKSFDIPFVIKRSNLYGIETTLNQIKQIDFYNEARHVSHYLGLDNLKLPTVEKHYGFFRNDTFTGGELINVYKHFQSTGSKESYSALMLHNKEDLIGLYYTLNISTLVAFIFTTDWEQEIPEVIDYVSHSDAIQLSFTVSTTLDYTFSTDNFHLRVFNHVTTLTLPIFNGELKYYLKDYKNYYYLPQEDKVIHKTLSKFVDAAFKEKAKKETCYIKKRGTFIPLPHESSHAFKFFKENYCHPTHYIEFPHSIPCESKSSFHKLLRTICITVLNSL